MIAPIRIGPHDIGPGHPCLVIAEAGVNHNGDAELAHRLVDAAADAGADVVKFQCFQTGKLVTAGAAKADYQRATTGEGGQEAMLRALELPVEVHAALLEHCGARGITYLCTPYDDDSADMLERIGVSGFKIASTDTTNTPFLARLAARGLPTILSTGMCGLGDVEAAVAAWRAVPGHGGLALLHCLAEYPAPMEQLNLRAMATLERAFRVPVGYSDHTAGIDAASWAAVLGAAVIEKHFTLDRALPGPDHRASVEPGEMREMIRSIRCATAALGDGVKRVMPAEAANEPVMRKSLVSLRPIPAGAPIGEGDVAAKRPGLGLAPSWGARVVGRRARVAIPADTPLTLDMIVWDEGRDGGG